MTETFKIWEDGQEPFFVQASSMPEALDKAAQELGFIDYPDLAQARGWAEADGLNIEVTDPRQPGGAELAAALDDLGYPELMPGQEGT
jgi:hypothetical protein